MGSYLEKIKSRKFQVAVSGVITGLVVMFSDAPEDQAASLAQQVIGGVVAVASIVAYLFAQGKVDQVKEANGQK